MRVLVAWDDSDQADLLSLYLGNEANEIKICLTAEEFAANLGIENLRYAATINIGGAAPVASLQSAAMAVGSGAADYVLIMGGWNAYSGSRTRQAVNADTSALPGRGIARDYYLSFGLTAPPQWYALMARRHSTA